jgi:hypothetical protein
MDESGRSGYDLVRVGAEHGVPMARDGEGHDEHLIAGVVRHQHSRKNNRNNLLFNSFYTVKKGFITQMG